MLPRLKPVSRYTAESRRHEFDRPPVESHEKYHHTVCCFRAHVTSIANVIAIVYIILCAGVIVAAICTRNWHWFPPAVIVIILFAVAVFAKHRPTLICLLVLMGIVLTFAAIVPITILLFFVVTYNTESCGNLEKDGKLEKCLTISSWVFGTLFGFLLACWSYWILFYYYFCLRDIAAIYQACDQIEATAASAPPAEDVEPRSNDNRNPQHRNYHTLRPNNQQGQQIGWRREGESEEAPPPPYPGT